MVHEIPASNSIPRSESSRRNVHRSALAAGQTNSGFGRQGENDPPRNDILGFFVPGTVELFSENSTLFRPATRHRRRPASATCKVGCALYRLRFRFLMAGLRSDVFQIESFLFDFQFQQLFTVTYHFEVTLPLVIDE